LNVVTHARLNQLGELSTRRGGGLDGGRRLVVGTVMVKGKDQQSHYQWNLKSDEPKPTDKTKQEYGTTLALGRPNMELSRSLLPNSTGSSATAAQLALKPPGSSHYIDRNYNTT